MKDEISAAVVFITKIVRKSKHLNSENVATFSEQLARVLMSRFRNHWYEENPSKGQGYRCIRCSIDEPRDTALEKAAEASGIDYGVLNLPAEMTLWVDPREVTCRFGERGTCCTIATFVRIPDSSDEDIVDNNSNPPPPGGYGRIPSPETLMEQSKEYERLRKSKLHQNNFRNDLFNTHYTTSTYSPSHTSSTYSPSRTMRRPQQLLDHNMGRYRWVNNDAVSVRS